MSPKRKRGPLFPETLYPEGVSPLRPKRATTLLFIADESSQAVKLYGCRGDIIDNAVIGKCQEALPDKS
jgi:hypothetical protein